jgi:hypothetical protein
VSAAAADVRVAHFRVGSEDCAVLSEGSNLFDALNQLTGAVQRPTDSSALTKC